MNLPYPLWPIRWPLNRLQLAIAAGLATISGVALIGLLLVYAPLLILGGVVVVSTVVAGVSMGMAVYNQSREK